jgi:hypothetical protein
MSFLYNMNKGTDTNSLEQFCVYLCSYNNKLTSEQNTWERNPLFQLAYDPQRFQWHIPSDRTMALLYPFYDLQLQHAKTRHTTKCSVSSVHFHFSSVMCQPPVSDASCFWTTGMYTLCTTIVFPFIYFYALVCLMFIFIFVSILTEFHVTVWLQTLCTG